MNRNQILGCCVVVLSVLMISTAQLTDLFGPTAAKSIVSASAILNGILGGWVTIMSNQKNMVQDVSSMTGVEPIKINAQASPSLAALAVDPNAPNVGATTPTVRSQLQEIAKG